MQLSLKESVGIINKNNNFTEIEAKNISKKLNNDPFLIGLFIDIYNDKEDLNKLIDNVIESFISYKVEETSRKSVYLADDYNSVLKKLNKQMLFNSNFNPFWESISNFISNEEMNILRDFIKNGTLCKIIRGKIEFIHDRIHESFLVESMKEIIMYDSNNPILKEPFYSKIIGKAVSKQKIDLNLLERLKNENFLVLIETLKNITTDNPEYENLIILIKKYLGSIDFDQNISILEALNFSLFDFDSPIVLELTENFPNNRSTYLLRLQNGSIEESISHALELHYRIYDSKFKQILEHSKDKHPKIIKNLKKTLASKKISDKIRCRALNLAGYLGTTDLKQEIMTSWDLLNEKELAMDSVLFAFIRCFDDDVNSINPIIDYWDKMSDEKDSHGTSPKFCVVEELHHTIEHYTLEKNIINYLISKTKEKNSLKHSIMHLIQYNNTPESIDFLVREISFIHEELDGTDNLTFWDLHFLSDWNGMLGAKRKLSEDCMKVLKSNWTNENNSKYLRYLSFSLWSTGVNKNDLNTLKTIDKKSSLFYSSVIERVKLGDFTVLGDFIKELKNENYLFREAHNVYGKEMRKIAEKYLGDLKNKIPTDFTDDGHDFIIDFLSKIPISESSSLLSKYWNHLQYSTTFIQLCFYINTKETIKLAKSTIKRVPKNIKIFKLFVIRFIFNSDKDRFDTMEHYNNLTEYLSLFSKSDLSLIAQKIQELNFICWGEKHVSKFLEESQRKNYYPTYKELIEELNNFNADKTICEIDSWLRDSERRNIDENRMIKILKEYLKDNRDKKDLLIAGEIIKHVGTRNNLGILELFSMDEDMHEITKDIEFHVKYHSLK